MASFPRAVAIKGGVGNGQSQQTTGPLSSPLSDGGGLVIAPRSLLHCLNDPPLTPCPGARVGGNAWWPTVDGKNR